ncbi:MAG: hypothetical protein QM723_27125 [Myxococcaceae bacterium]
MRGLSLVFALWASVASAMPELDEAWKLYRENQSTQALPILGRIAQNLDAAPGDRAQAYLLGALCRGQLNDLEAARRNFVSAFSLDPSLALPEGVSRALVELSAEARNEAIAAINARLTQMARNAELGITSGAAPPPAPAAVAASPSAPPPVTEEKKEVEPPPEPEPPRAPPTALSSHLGAGVSGFYLVGDKAAGPRIDVAGGGRVGRSLWLGGALGVWLGTTTAASAAVRLSSYSDKPVAFMMSADAGVLYAGATSSFLPYAQLNPLGMQIRTSALIIEARISICILVSGGSIHWVPTGGAGVLF